MKIAILSVATLLICSLSHALTPTNKCGKGNKMVAAYGCADAQTGGSYSLGGLIICSQMKDGKNVGYTSLLDDNVVAYGGGYSYGVVIQTATQIKIVDGQDVDTLDLATGLAEIQHNKMKCQLSRD